MWRLTVANLWTHKRRLAGTTTAVVLGVAFLVAALATGDTMTGGFDRLFRTANAGTAVVVRANTVIGAGELRERGSVDATLADSIASLEGVDATAAVTTGVTQLLDADGTRIGGGGPPTDGVNWLGDTPLNPWRLDDGRAPGIAARGEPYEVVIDRGTANRAGLTVGMTTTALTPAAVPVTVVGIATFGSANSLGAATFTAFEHDAAVELLGRAGAASEIRVAARHGVSSEELQAEIQALLPTGTEAITGTELTDEMLADVRGGFVDMFEYILVAFAGIAVVVAAFSINNTFSIITAQRARESALLRAVGASRRQVLSTVAAEATAVGAVASAIGFAAGCGLALALRALLSASGLDLGGRGLIVDPSTIVIAVVVGLGATLLASLGPAVRASRVAPLEALRASAVDASGTSRSRLLVGIATASIGIVTLVTATAGGGALTRAGLGAAATLVGAVILGPVVVRPATSVIGFLPRLAHGHAGRLAHRNARRDPRRTASSASALMVGTAVVALFATVGASVKATIEHTVDKDFGGDLVISADDFSGAGMADGIVDDVAALDGVETAAGLGFAVLTLDGRDSDPMVTEPAALDAVLDLGVIDGSMATMGPGDLAVSEDYARRHNLDVGSAVTAGFSDGATETLRVGAVYTSTTNVGDTLIHRADWAAHNERTAVIVVLIDLADGVSESAGADAVAAVSAAHHAPEPQTRTEYIDTIGSQIDQMLVFVYGMLGVAVLIALMGIANTLGLSVHERTRELGLLRAIGQTRAQVRATVRWESVIVAILGTVGGLAVGTFLAWGLLQALAAEIGFGTFALPITTLAVIVAAAALAGIGAAWRPARRASQIDILDALAMS